MYPQVRVGRRHCQAGHLTPMDVLEAILSQLTAQIIAHAAPVLSSGCIQCAMLSL